MLKQSRSQLLLDRIFSSTVVFSTQTFQYRNVLTASLVKMRRKRKTQNVKDLTKTPKNAEEPKMTQKCDHQQ